MTLPHMSDVCLRIIQHLPLNGGVNYGLRKKQWIFFRSIGGSFHFVDYCRSCFSLLSKIIIRKRKPLPTHAESAKKRSHFLQKSPVVFEVDKFFAESLHTD